jgi:hypothetical protein
MAGVYSQSYSSGNPQAPQAVTILNADYDRAKLNHDAMNASKSEFDRKPIMTHLRTPHDPNNCNAMPRELAFMNRYEYDVKLQRSGNGANRNMRIFTTANNMAILVDPKDVLTQSPNLQDKDKIKKMEEEHIGIVLLRDQITFVGVPLTRMLFDENLRSTGNDKVPVQISGSTTIWNTGPYDIHPGDKVMWDIPHSTSLNGALTTKQVPGLPTSKKLFWTVPYRDALRSRPGTGGASDMTVAGLLDVLHPTDGRLINGTQPRPDKLSGDGTFSKMMNDFEVEINQNKRTAGQGQDVKAREKLEEILYVWNLEMQSHTNRVIGIALKGASPGGAFDIMLQRA